MVALNLTFFIELGLFLVFLWLAHLIVFKPTLKTMDERESRIAENRTRAREERAEAQALSARYADEIFAARRAATQRLEQARQEALEKRTSAIQERRRAIDESIRDVRRSAKKQLESERAQIDTSADEIARAIAEELAPKGVRL